MSKPFLYTPDDPPPSQPSSPRRRPAHAPFIPSPSLLSNAPLAPSPFLPANRPVFGNDQGDILGDTKAFRRVRRPSWQGPAPFGPQGFAPASLHPGSFLAPAPAPQSVPRERRHSFGSSQAAPFPWARSSSSGQTTDLNPLLDARSPRPDFHFSLSDPRFAPVRLLLGYGASQSVLLPDSDLDMPATHPPVSKMVVVHPDIKGWDIGVRPSRLSHVSLGDVLSAVHGALHTPIIQADYDRLDRAAQTRVARAYGRRCKGVADEQDRRRGVKVIDYLRVWDEPGRREVRLVGLVPERGGEVWKLVVA